MSHSENWTKQQVSTSYECKLPNDLLNKHESYSYIELCSGEGGIYIIYTSIIIKR